MVCIVVDCRKKCSLFKCRNCFMFRKYGYWLPSLFCAILFFHSPSAIPKKLITFYFLCNSLIYPWAVTATVQRDKKAIYVVTSEIFLPAELYISYVEEHFCAARVSL